MANIEKISFTPKQTEAYIEVKTKDIVVYGGAIRGGKTYFMLLVFVILAKRFPKSRWIIVRKDYARMEETTLKTWNYLLEMGLKGEIKKRKNYTYTFKNGSQIIFFGELYEKDKELNRFRGLECNGFGLDEMNELQEGTFDKCIERAGTWFNSEPDANGVLCPTRVIGTCNPTKNWVKTKFHDKWAKGQLPPNWSYIPAKITDNPHVPVQYLSSLKLNMTPSSYRRFVEGDWDFHEKTGNEWCYNFEPDIHVGDVPFIRGHPVKLTFDFNLHPYQTMLCIQFIKKTVNEEDWTFIRVFKEYCSKSPNNYPEFGPLRFEKQYIKPFGWIPLDIYGDASGQGGLGINGYKGIFEKVAAYTHNKSNRIFKRNPNPLDARDLLNDILGGTYKIKLMIDRNRCPNLIQDLEELQEGSDGSFDKKKEKVNGIMTELRGHPYSALIYCVIKEYEKLLRANKKLAA